MAEKKPSKVVATSIQWIIVIYLAETQEGPPKIA